MRQPVRAGVRPHPQSRHHARRPLPRRPDRRRILRAGPADCNPRCWSPDTSTRSTGPNWINAELIRLRDAVQYLHDETVTAMNAGDDVRDAMARITLPPHLEVGQGYGKVSWNVRAIWENYNGWFHRRSTTELYPVGPESVAPDLVELAGAQAICDRAGRYLDAGDTATRDPPRRDRAQDRARDTRPPARSSKPPTKRCSRTERTSGNQPGFANRSESSHDRTRNL